MFRLLPLVLLYKGLRRNDADVYYSAGIITYFLPVYLVFAHVGIHLSRLCRGVVSNQATRFNAANMFFRLFVIYVCGCIVPNKLAFVLYCNYKQLETFAA